MLRTIIQTRKELDALRTSLKSTLTVGQINKLFGSFVTDSAIQANLDAVTGKKPDRKLSNGEVDSFIATLLQFNNDRAMFDHYNNQTLYNVFSAIHEHKHGEDRITFAVPENIDLSRLDIIALTDIDFDFLSRQNEWLGEISLENQGLTYEQACDLDNTAMYTGERTVVTGEFVKRMPTLGNEAAAQLARIMLDCMGNSSTLGFEEIGLYKSMMKDNNALEAAATSLTDVGDEDVRIYTSRQSEDMGLNTLCRTAAKTAGFKDLFDQAVTDIGESFKGTGVMALSNNHYVIWSQELEVAVIMSDDSTPLAFSALTQAK